MFRAAVCKEIAKPLVIENIPAPEKLNESQVFIKGVEKLIWYRLRGRGGGGGGGDVSVGVKEKRSKVVRRQSFMKFMWLDFRRHSYSHDDRNVDP